MSIVRMGLVPLILWAGVLTASCSSDAGPASSSALAVSTTAATPAVDQQMMDAAVADLTAQLTKPAKLDGIRMKAAQGWVFLNANIKDPGGQWIDYAGTPFAEAAANGGKSKKYVALLRNEGAWTVVASRLGPTDVAWANWSTEYSAPPEIFELPPQ